MIKKKIYVISEIGINHNGEFSKIKKLIYLSKKAGADAVKFQLYNPETLGDKNIKKRYRLFKKFKKITLYEMWSKVCIKTHWLKKIEKICKDIKIDLGFSIFDYQSLKKLENINYKFIKIASGDLNDHYLIKKFLKTRKLIVLSSGMSNEKEIKQTCKLINNTKHYLLHCISLYPTLAREVNLKRMIKLSKFTKNVGFSDHTIGPLASIKAISMGAKMIEKHFTFDKNADGPDHKLSADFEDLKLICEFARNNSNYLGKGFINPTKKELRMRKFARKSIFAKKRILVGEKFSIDNIESRRPGIGIPAFKFEDYLNKTSKKEYIVGEIIKII